MHYYGVTTVECVVGIGRLWTVVERVLLSVIIIGVICEDGKSICWLSVRVGVIREVGKQLFHLFSFISTSNAPPCQAWADVGVVGMTILWMPRRKH